MKCPTRSILLVVLTICVTGSVGRSRGLSYVELLKKLTDAKANAGAVDVRTNLRSIRELAIQSGLMVPKNETTTTMTPPTTTSLPSSAPALHDHQLLELRRIDPSRKEQATAMMGRKKGQGGGSNNNIVVTDGGGGGHGGGSYHVYSEESGEGGKKGKKGRKKRNKRKKHRKGWKKHMKKAVPIGLGILALKALLLHFVLKKLVLATGLSLLLSKKSLLVSALIALKLMFQHPHSSDKSESSKLEVVHIPIRKETGFHKKIQLQKVKVKPQFKIKKLTTTKKPGYGPYAIKHTHQQMEDFGGKYIPLGYESQQHNYYDITTPPPSTYVDQLPETGEDNFFDVNDLQFARRDGWDGWTGWNRGENGDPYGGAFEQKQFSDGGDYGQGYYNSHGGFFQQQQQQQQQNNEWTGQVSGDSQTPYKQRNLAQMKYRRRRLAVGRTVK
ncbi:hypothetical protein quinque_013472 [Culex quinquefasciatus]